MNKLAHVKLFGSWPMAQLSRQEGLSYFEHEHGYIAYKNGSTGSTVSVLGDPICDSQDTETLLTEFINTHPKACFYHLQDNSAKILSRLGYYISSIGNSQYLELKNFKGSWNSHSSLRSGSNKALRKAIEIKEARPSEQNQEQLKDIHQNWTKNRPNPHEQGFLIRPLDFKNREDYRYFYAYNKDKLIGFSIFSPLYKNNTVIGYYLDNYRYHSAAPKGCCDLMIYSAIKKFQKEGYKTLELGLSPFSKLTPHPYKNSLLLKTVFKLIYKLNIPNYAYQGIAGYHQKFHAKESPIFFASPGPFPIKNLWQTWRFIARRK